MISEILKIKKMYYTIDALALVSKIRSALFILGRLIKIVRSE